MGRLIITIRCTYELPYYCNYFYFAYHQFLYTKLIHFGSYFGQIQLFFKNSFFEHMVLSFSTIYTRLTPYANVYLSKCTNTSYCYKCKVFC